MSFSHPEYLVSTAWLAEHLDDPNVRILDVTAKLTSSLVNRAEEDCFKQGHIPGSHFFDVPSGKGVLSDAEAELPWMWPNPKQFAETMAAFGVGPDTRVVLVARTPRPGLDSGTMWCTRAWWTMHNMGVECAILQGGVEAWETEGRKLSVDESPIPTAPPFVVSAGWERARANKEDVLAATTSPVCLVDALTEDSFDGTGAAYGPRAGHIETAINLSFRSLIDAETASFVDSERMRDRLDGAGLFDQSEIITYCGGAIAATVDAFCLALFGHTGVSVYDGSLMEWSADPNLPMSH